MLPSRSRLVALGLSVGALAGLVVGMAATARPQPPPPSPVTTPAPDTTIAGVGQAEPATNPFADRPSITQTGAS